MFSKEQIADSYRRKISSYDKKYSIGYYTHIHTGLFDPLMFPVLHQSGIDFERFDIERIRHLMIMGQEILTNNLCQLLMRNNPKLVLDCGAGHGGTSIYIAENHQIQVHALTISQAQADLIKTNIAASGLEKLITVETNDIRNKDMSDDRFDGIIGTDAFCQMGSHDTLFKRLHAALNLGGQLIIADYYANPEKLLGQSFKQRFDAYWTSDISSVALTLDAALSAGFTIREFKDCTTLQLPFWRLSVAHSAISLSQEQDPPSEQERFEQSRLFHLDMLHAFEERAASYNILVLEKSM